MTKKTIVTLVIVAVFLLMLLDFNINGAGVFESYFREMETESMHKIDGFQNMDFSSEQARKISEMVINTEDTDQLQITNIGSINITGEKRDNLKIKAVINVYADSEKQAREFLPELEIKSGKSEGRINLQLNEVNIPRYIKGIKVDYEITAPERLALLLKNKFGEMDVSNFSGDVNLNNMYKMMQVRDIRGDVLLDARYGDLYVENITGKTMIINRYNKATVKNISNNLELDAKYSDINLSSISGEMDIDTAYGKLNIDDVPRNIDLNSRYTKISVFNIKGILTADLEYGDFKIEEIINDVNIRAKYTGLYFKLSSEVDNYIIDCTTRYGDIDSVPELQVREDGNEKSIRGNTGKEEKGVQIKVNGDYSDIIINE